MSCWTADQVSSACSQFGIDCPPGGQCMAEAVAVNPQQWANLDPEIVKALLLSQQDFPAIIRSIGTLGIVAVCTAAVAIAFTFFYYRYKRALVEKWDGKCRRQGKRAMCDGCECDGESKKE